MAAAIEGVFEDNLRNAVLESKVLLVGAGGIGCEVLKNLVMSGFKDIEIIDLDTIDVSNLNRQFLFHKEHVGKSKAAVARESALKFNPTVNIKAHHDSITSTGYGVSFFKKFTLVMNALDNAAARNHVNRMCLASDRPLIESGTAGYSGQVELIKKGVSECYECQPKAAQKTFPGCTIRNTPSELIHCIVWSKHLFNQLFGEYDGDEEVSPDTADPEAAGNAGETAMETDSNEKGNVERVSTRQWAENIGYNPEKLFTKLFSDDIKYLLSMHNLWKERRPPTPLVWGKLPDAVAGTSSTILDSGLKDQRSWSIAECAEVLSSSINSLKGQLSSRGSSLVWDKDDRAAMDFVAACANIRAYIFGIEQKSRFDIKSMAGNIIPAIATANAIVAGLVVLLAFRVLQDQFDRCQSVYLRLKPNHRHHLFVPDKNLNKPNEKCYVCSPQPQVVVVLDVHKTTVKEFEENVLKKSLNMVAPDAICESLVVISSEEGETEENNDKILSELRINDGSILKVDDFLQNYALVVTIVHKEGTEVEVITDSTLQPNSSEDKKQETPIPSSNGSGPAPKNVSEDDDDDLCIVEEDDLTNVQSRKRKTSTEEMPSKKPRLESNLDDDDDLEIIEDTPME